MNAFDERIKIGGQFAALFFSWRLGGYRLICRALNLDLSENLQRSPYGTRLDESDRKETRDRILTAARKQAKQNG